MRKPAVPQAGSRMVSFFCGAMTSTMKSMMWRGVRNWPASPWVSDYTLGTHPITTKGTNGLGRSEATKRFGLMFT